MNRQRNEQAQRTQKTHRYRANSATDAAANAAAGERIYVKFRKEAVPTRRYPRLLMAGLPGERS
jgi:hypothetical protein